MPISIVIGGQFGSEGKGKVSLELARESLRRNCALKRTVVRVGGPNSGHTAYDRQGKRWALRQLPAACIDRDVDVVFPAGSYLDLEVLFSEIERLDFPRDRISVSPWARVISDEDKAWEKSAALGKAIGSTGSGVGGAVMAHVARGAENFSLISHDAEHCDRLSDFVKDTTEKLTNSLSEGERVIIEGSQGFGLSLLDGGFWPKATSRSTTAAAALSEAGLSPLDVDDVTMVIRTFPIRVAGKSGPLLNEMTWENVADVTGRQDDISEYTTVTKKLRRVGRFDAALVRRAIRANNPTRIVLNHLDYIDDHSNFFDPSSMGRQFVETVQREIGRSIDWVGFSGDGVVSNTTGLSIDVE